MARQVEHKVNMIVVDQLKGRRIPVRCPSYTFGWPLQASEVNNLKTWESSHLTGQYGREREVGARLASRLPWQIPVIKLGAETRKDIAVSTVIWFCIY